MNPAGCSAELLGLLVLGALGERESEPVRVHVQSCQSCQHEIEELKEARAVLQALPPAWLPDGPPPGGDLLLQRTLRAMRAEESRVWRRGILLRGVAAVAVIVISAAGGGVIGRDLAPGPDQVAQATPSPTSSVPGTREGSVTDPATRVTMAVTLVPAAGWVRIKVSVGGIPAGENCRLIVVSASGTREVAGGWIVSEKGQHSGTTLDGTAAIAIDEVAAVEVENTSGKRFVSLTI